MARLFLGEHIIVIQAKQFRSLEHFDAIAIRVLTCLTTSTITFHVLHQQHQQEQQQKQQQWDLQVKQLHPCDVVIMSLARLNSNKNTTFMNHNISNNNTFKNNNNNNSRTTGKLRTWNTRHTLSQQNRYMLSKVLTLVVIFIP